MFSLTICVASAVRCTLRAISAVAAPCCSTAAAMVVAIVLTSSIVLGDGVDGRHGFGCRTLDIARSGARFPRSPWRSGWRVPSPRTPQRQTPCRHRPRAPPRSWHSAPANSSGHAMLVISSTTCPILSAPSGQRADNRVGAPGILHGALADFRRLRHLPGNFPDAGRQLFRRRRNGLHAGARLPPHACPALEAC